MHNEYFNKDVQFIEIFKKVKFQGVIYDKFDSKTKRSNFCFHTKDLKKRIGLIEYIFFDDSIPYIMAKKVVSFFNPFFSTKCPELKSHLSICHVKNEYFIEKLDNIKKSVFIECKPGDQFVSEFCTGHLFS